VSARNNAWRASRASSATGRIQLRADWRPGSRGSSRCWCTTSPTHRSRWWPKWCRRAW